MRVAWSNGRMSGAILVLANLLAAAAGSFAAASNAPPWQVRGDRVEARSIALTAAISGLREEIRSSLRVAAPELLDELDAQATSPPRCAPGRLPTLVPATPPPSPRPPPRSSRYSWPWTEQKLAQVEVRLDALRAALRDATSTGGTARHDALHGIVREYRELAEGQRIAIEHLRYNRLWQADVVARRPYYDRMTRLHDLVVSQQAGTPAPEDARAEIRAELDRIAVPSWVEVEQAAPASWIIRLMVRTDIGDTAFLARLEKTVEDVWRLRDGGDEWKLDVRMLPSPGGPPFPRDAAGLTTGADSTHADGGTVFLGCGDLDERALAHEFGHLLGFRDEYFRGYRDLGGDGFEIVEIVADPEHLMGNPKDGVVTRRYFEKVVAGARVRPRSP